MNLGVQYYRAPFPNSRHWSDDFDRIRKSGFNTVQLWVLWGWVEAKPGVFNFDDYDALMELAEKKGLGVVLSTIGEIHPHWIHREVPGSEMIDHMGHKVISSIRLECHFGLTPGGCTDHPGVMDRMGKFLGATVDRYKGSAALRGWDCWNELRWNVHADGYVCFCEHTLREFRGWLDAKYGGLDGLNRAWERRYDSWEDVHPGKMPVRPFTENMAFNHFLTWRANKHGRDRYEIVKSRDPLHRVTVHPASPSPLDPGGIASSNPHLIEWNQAINRGNDWFFADDLDGIGCSSFPKWGNQDDVDFYVRMNYMKSAARGKPMWLSELQGSAAMTENKITAPVQPAEQQRWLWQGVAAGAEAVLFWCWRDEVFGREAGGFGISGNDGFADERLAAMAKTGAILGQHGDLLQTAKQLPAQVGIMFSPQSFYLNWSQEGDALLTMDSLQNYARALSRRHIPFVVVEEEHLEVLDGLKVLFLPRTLVMDKKQEEAIEKFVRGGGILFAESESGAWDSRGVWRYPEERLMARLTSVRELGRRQIHKPTFRAVYDGKAFSLTAAQWFTPMVAGLAAVLSPWEDPRVQNPALLTLSKVDEGYIFLCGTFLGNGITRDNVGSFDSLVETIVHTAGVREPVFIERGEVQGDATLLQAAELPDGRKLLYVFASPQARSIHLRFRPGFLRGSALIDLMTGVVIPVDSDTAELLPNPATWNIMALVES